MNKGTHSRGEWTVPHGSRPILTNRDWNGDQLRWNIGIEAYREIDDYRNYLINHEVGHALGCGRRTCPSPGEPAPVMQQQTKTMQSCRPNAWPATADSPHTNSHAK